MELLNVEESARPRHRAVFREIADNAQAPAPSPRRILFVDHTASLGGGEIALLNLVRRLDPARFHPIVVLFSEGPLLEQLRSAGVETHVLPIDSSVLHTRKDAIGVGTLLKFGVVFRSIGQI